MWIILPLSHSTPARNLLLLRTVLLKGEGLSKWAAAFSTGLGSFWERKIVLDPHRGLAYVLTHLCRGSGGFCWRARNRVYREFSLLTNLSGSNELIIKLSWLFFSSFKKSRFCREMEHSYLSSSNTYFKCVEKAGKLLNSVSLWLDVENLACFFPTVIWLNRCCPSLQTLFLLLNVAAQIMAVVYILPN